MSKLNLFDFINSYFGCDRETTIVCSGNMSAFQSESIIYFQKIVKTGTLTICDLITKKDFTFNNTSLIDYFTFINDKIIIYVN